MTQEQYAAYEATVAAFFTTQGVNSLSASTDIHPFFAASPCECCRTTLAGDRWDALAYHPATKTTIGYSVCYDCLYYVEHGELDDMTMLDMDNE